MEKKGFHVTTDPNLITSPCMLFRYRFDHCKYTSLAAKDCLLPNKTSHYLVSISVSIICESYLASFRCREENENRNTGGVNKEMYHILLAESTFGYS